MLDELPTFGASVPLTTIAWLFTAGVLAHNAEEACWLPGWYARQHRARPRVGAREFRFAVAVLSAAQACITLLASLTGPGTAAAYVLAGCAFAMAGNALVPHLVATLALRGYMPGTATGVLLNIPLGCILLGRAVQERYVEWRVLIWAAPLTALVIAATIPALFVLGRRVLTPTGRRVGWRFHPWVRD